MNDPDRQRCEKLLRECVDKLSEHCDSVRIFITLPTSDGESNTAAMDEGAGNFYAQLGQVQEWLLIQEQYQRNWADRRDAERS